MLLNEILYDFEEHCSVDEADIVDSPVSGCIEGLVRYGVDGHVCRVWVFTNTPIAVGSPLTHRVVPYSLVLHSNDGGEEVAVALTHSTGFSKS